MTTNPHLLKPSQKVLYQPSNRRWAQRIYSKLMIVVPGLWEIDRHAKSLVEGCLDLNLDILVVAENYRRIALSRHWKHESGDMIPDPDMEVAVYRDWEMAEALTYQDMWSFDQVFPIQDGAADHLPYLHCNAFLEKWLEALAEQGHLLRK